MFLITTKMYAYFITLSFVKIQENALQKFLSIDRNAFKFFVTLKKIISPLFLKNIQAACIVGQKSGTPLIISIQIIVEK